MNHPQIGLNFSELTQPTVVTVITASTPDQDVLKLRGRGFWIGWLKAKYGMGGYRKYLNTLEGKPCQTKH